MVDNDEDHVVRIDKKSGSGKKAIIIGAVVAVVVIVGIAVLTFALPSGGNAEMTGTLISNIEQIDYSHHKAVRVTLQGYITNEGNVAGAAEVIIEVYNGSSWSTFTSVTNVIAAEGGMLWFSWSMEFISDDATAFQVRYTISEY